MCVHAMLYLCVSVESALCMRACVHACVHEISAYFRDSAITFMVHSVRHIAFNNSVV